MVAMVHHRGLRETRLFQLDRIDRKKIATLAHFAVSVLGLNPNRRYQNVHTMLTSMEKLMEHQTFRKTNAFRLNNNRWQYMQTQHLTGNLPVRDCPMDVQGDLVAAAGWVAARHLKDTGKPCHHRFSSEELIDLMKSTGEASTWRVYPCNHLGEEIAEDIDDDETREMLAASIRDNIMYVVIAESVPVFIVQEYPACLQMFIERYLEYLCKHSFLFDSAEWSHIACQVEMMLDDFDIDIYDDPDYGQRLFDSLQSIMRSDSPAWMNRNSTWEIVKNRAEVTGRVYPHLKPLLNKLMRSTQAHIRVQRNIGNWQYPLMESLADYYGMSISGAECLIGEPENELAISTISNDVLKAQYSTELALYISARKPHLMACWIYHANTIMGLLQKINQETFQ